MAGKLCSHGREEADHNTQARSDTAGPTSGRRILNDRGSAKGCDRPVAVQPTLAHVLLLLLTPSFYGYSQWGIAVASATPLIQNATSKAPAATASTMSPGPGGPVPAPQPSGTPAAIDPAAASEAVWGNGASGSSGSDGRGGGGGGGLDSLLLGPSFDASLDWAANITAKGAHGCTLPKLPGPPSRLPPRCPRPSRPVGLREARKLGWKFAPLLHQHPLDWSRLSDPGPWLAGATLVDPLTYATTDLHTHLANRHKARRARSEAAVAEAEAAAAAAAEGDMSGRGGAVTAAAAAAKAAAAAEAAAAAAAAADPYWLIHESYDTHNFFASRLVRRRYQQPGAGAAPPAAGAAAQQQQQGSGAGGGTGPHGRAAQQGSADREGVSAGTSYNESGAARADAGAGQRRRRWLGEGARSLSGSGEGGVGRAAAAADQKGAAAGAMQDDPYWPQFEALQGDAFFDAIAGDPLEQPGVGPLEAAGEEAQGEEAGGGGRRGSWGASRGLGRGGRLGGKVYYTVFEPSLEHLQWSTAARGADQDAFSASAEPEPSYAYVYTYWFFYPFNGCSNQLMATRFAGRQQGAEYWLCPLGVHEGDWEHLKVYVCQEGMRDEADPAAAVAALQYSQHTWLPTYDCTQGECSFSPDPDAGFRRPLVYAGLHSHANSPHTSPLNVYAKINFKQLLNFDGIYVADRFAAGGPVFVPRPNNTAWLPFHHEMHEAEAEEPGAAARLAWAAYQGNWGVPLSSPNFSLTCLHSNLTAAGRCDPRNPPVFILDRLLGGVEMPPQEMTWTPVLSPKRVAPELSEGITGPLVRRAAPAAWERELAAPLWDDREPLPGLGGLSLATLARDTSSLACPLTEDARRTSVPSYLGLGGDPRLGAQLRLFVAAATAAVLAAAAASALVVKCMPLILAPYHGHTSHGYHGHHGYHHDQPHHNHHHEPADEHEAGGHRHAGVFSRSTNGPYEALPQYDKDGTERSTATTWEASGSGRRRQLVGRAATAPPASPPVAESLSGEGAGGRRRSASLSPSESYEPYGGATDSDDGVPPPDAATVLPELQLTSRSPRHEPTAAAPPLRGRRSLGSEGGAAGAGAGAASASAFSTAAATAAAAPGGGSGSGGGCTAGFLSGAGLRRGSGELQPLLAGGDGGGGGTVHGGGSGLGGDDDDWEGKPRRGGGGAAGNGCLRRCGVSRVCRAVACPAAALLPLLAWRGCVALCRGAVWACGVLLCHCCGRRRRRESGGGGESVVAEAPKRRRRRGLGPYLLGCATQPERRLLWLSLGIMAYSLGLILSAQGLLQTLHALRNLLLRGLWAIAGLEGIFVALLAAGGVLELSLMVAAVALGPKPPTWERHRAPRPHRKGPQPHADAAPPGSGVPLSTAPFSGGSNGSAASGTDASAGSLGLYPAFYSAPHALHFPSSADVAATAAAATAAASAAAQAAAAAAAHAAARVPWRTLALLCAVGYMEVAASLHLLGFGMALWVGVLGASEGCSAAVQGLYRVISFSPDVCLDLSVIGVPGPRCGGDLMRLCNVWRQLRLSGLLYGSLLIIAARLLLLVMATANYHSRHAILLPFLPRHPHSGHPSHHPYPNHPGHLASHGRHAELFELAEGEEDPGGRQRAGGAREPGATEPGDGKAVGALRGEEARAPFAQDAGGGTEPRRRGRRRQNLDADSAAAGAGKEGAASSVAAAKDLGSAEGVGGGGSAAEAARHGVGAARSRRALAAHCADGGPGGVGGVGEAAAASGVRPRAARTTSNAAANAPAASVPAARDSNEAAAHSIGTGGGADMDGRGLVSLSTLPAADVELGVLGGGHTGGGGGGGGGIVAGGSISGGSSRRREGGWKFGF